MLQDIPPAPDGAAELRAWNSGSAGRSGEMTARQGCGQPPEASPSASAPTCNQFLAADPDQRLRRRHGRAGTHGGAADRQRNLSPRLGRVVTGFIVSFGIVKALTNLISGQLAESWGRKHTLVLGWLVGLPVPFMIMWAPSWGWIIAANVLLGVNQGLAWSMTVLMKIDLVGPKSRGLAVGLNEFAGYGAVGLTAFLTGWIAARYGLRPSPFYLGAVYAVLGLGLSVLVVRDTGDHVATRFTRTATARPRRWGSGRSSAAPASATAASSPPARPGSSTISRTAWSGGCSRCSSSPTASASSGSAS